ncbi:DUF4190 domain-containing protein [Candidatus Saccharibacteria bacterium]|nr:DUF4190 domain-containing protein [Candidatus Saccharibacteria bacterium]
MENNSSQPQQAAAPQAPVPNVSQPMAAAPAGGGKGLAVAALVLGIVAVCGAWIPFLNIFSLIIAIVGLILGLIATIMGFANKMGGKAMALVGTILSVAGIAIFFISYVLLAKGVGDALDDLFGVAENCDYHNGITIGFDDSGYAVSIASFNKTVSDYVYEQLETGMSKSEIYDVLGVSPTCRTNN